MTVGFHAPLPPVRSGVADYAASLLTELRKRGPVETGKTRDSNLYHLGNNQLHRAIYERAVAHPGVVVLHDAVLQHFYLGAFEQARYIEEYCYNYGEWERPVAADLYRERAGSGMDQRYFQRPMLKRAGERSLAVIVHNPAAASLVRQHQADARIIEIPHFVDEKVAWALGLREPEATFTFGILGYLRESKRIVQILQTFEALHHARPKTTLLLAGEFASPDLEKAVQPYLTHPAITRRNHLSDNEFWQAANSLGCCINLRAPAAGETSGIGIRLMGLGKTVIFTEGREIENLPQDACMRISAGPSESAELYEYMKIVVDLPEYSRAIGKRAAAYIRKVHSLDRVADQYWKVLCEAHTSRASSSSLAC